MCNAASASGLNETVQPLYPKQSLPINTLLLLMQRINAIWFIKILKCFYKLHLVPLPSEVRLFCVLHAAHLLQMTMKVMVGSNIWLVLCHSLLLLLDFLVAVGLLHDHLPCPCHLHKGIAIQRRHRSDRSGSVTGWYHVMWCHVCLHHWHIIPRLLLQLVK